jgi:hypothetical protein
MTKIVYAGRASHASVFTDDPQPREHAARLLWAVRHALADARHYGDAVGEIVSINDKTLSNSDFHRCAQLIREAAKC